MPIVLLIMHVKALLLCASYLMILLSSESFVTLPSRVITFPPCSAIRGRSHCGVRGWRSVPLFDNIPIYAVLPNGARMLRPPRFTIQTPIPKPLSVEVLTLKASVGMVLEALVRFHKRLKIKSWDCITTQVVSKTCVEDI